MIHLIASRLQHRYAPAPQPAAGKYVGVEAGADLAFIASIWLAAAGTMALGVNAILAGGRPGPGRDCPKPELGKRFYIGQVCKMMVISRDSFRFMELL